MADEPNSSSKGFLDSALDSVSGAASSTKQWAKDYVGDVKRGVGVAWDYAKENKATVGHAALDVVGVIPGLGEFADAANTGWYLGEGNLMDALFSGISLIPGAGDLVGKGARVTMKIIDAGGPKAIAAAKEMLGQLNSIGIDKIRSVLNMLPGGVGEKLNKALDDLLAKLKKVAGEEADEVAAEGVEGAGKGGTVVSEAPAPAAPKSPDAASEVPTKPSDTPAAESGTASGPASEGSPKPDPAASAGEPVDLIFGTVFVHQDDFALPWRVPFAWKRFYASDGRRRGAIGVGWECPADFRLELRDDGQVGFWGGKPGAVLFPAKPADSVSATETGDNSVLSAAPGEWRIRTKSGLTYAFAAPGGGTKDTPLRSITDLNGNTLIFVRREGRLAEIRSSCGPWLELKGEGQFVREVLLHHPSQPDRLLVRYDQSGAGDLIAVRDALDVPHRFTYRNHCLVEHSDRNGLTFRYQYDTETAQGRCVRTWGDNSLFDTHIRYQPEKRRAEAVESRGLLVVVEFDEQNRLIRRTTSLGEATTYTYDAAGRTAQVTDALGRVTAYRYDDHGNLLALTRPDGVELKWSYDATHCPVAFTDANGVAWRQKFDSRRRLVEQTSPLGANRRYRYNDRGDLVEYLNPLGATTRFQADPNGTALLRVTDALGHATAWEVDSLGHVLAATDPTGAVTRFAYDAKSRLVHVQKPSGTEVRCGYDRELNLTRFTDELGHETRFDYGYVNRLVARHLPNGTTVRYEYDTENRLTAVLNGRGERYTLQRDPAGRILAEIDYWGRATTYRYDPVGQLLESVDPLGRRTAFDRDPLGRLLARHFADGTEETFAYDANGNLVGTTSPHAQVQRAFDSEGRITEEQQNDFAVRYAYDAVGNVVQRTSTAGNDVRYTYDPVNRFVGLKVNGRDVVQVQRDARGLPLRERLGQHLVREHRYDADLRLVHQQTSVGERVLVQRDYTYDAAGNLLARTHLGRGTETFGYDPVGYILRHTDPEGRLQEFLRDAAGDFLRPETTEPFRPDSAVNPSPRPHGGEGQGEGEIPGSRSRRREEADPAPDDPLPVGRAQTPVPGREPYGRPIRSARFGDLTYRYNAAGNVIERRTRHGRTRLDWDCANRLTRGRSPDGIPVFMGYDAAGRRLSKTRQQVRREFGWDGDVLMAERGPKGWREYVQAPGGFAPVALVEGGRVFLYQLDQAGAALDLVTEEGRAVWSADYDAWGGVARQRTAEVENPLRLQGQYADDELGLSYNRHRYYDSATGGFVSADPLGLIAGENLFALAPNAQGWADPMGLTPSGAGASNVPSDAAKSGVADQVKVIGRLPDTAVAKPWAGHDVLDIPNWTPARNAQWVDDGIKNGQVFYTASPEAGNLVQTSGRFAGQPTIYAQELQQLNSAGYLKVGDYYVPASQAATFKP